MQVILCIHVALFSYKRQVALKFHGNCQSCDLYVLVRVFFCMLLIKMLTLAIQMLHQIAFSVLLYLSQPERTSLLLPRSELLLLSLCLVQ